MEVYSLLKTFHIISATVLFGTGLGIAFYFWMGGRSGDDRAALFAAKATVKPRTFCLQRQQRLPSR